LGRNTNKKHSKCIVHDPRPIRCRTPAHTYQRTGPSEKDPRKNRPKELPIKGWRRE